ncbi:MAG: MFS transporter, partial [SAR324 cluster bacterium]|nr:MFS transporter [SAR324 cluster bacterium]
MSNAAADNSKLNLLSYKGKSQTLHLAWVAFFLSFVVWFNHAPLLSSIKETFGLTGQQIKVLLILNVSLT